VRVATIADMARDGFAHGELQHGNVLVDANGQHSLIDLGAVWLPSLRPGLSHLPPPDEVGHPSYQPPFPVGWGMRIGTLSPAGAGCRVTQEPHACARGESLGEPDTTLHTAPQRCGVDLDLWSGLGRQLLAIIVLPHLSGPILKDQA
jgi:hypothetical protein